MINIQKKINRFSQKFINRFENIPPSDFGHKFHYNLLSLKNIKPLTKIKKQFVGQAITIRITPQDSILVYKALELAQPGDVLVIDMNGEDRYACWGKSQR